MIPTPPPNIALDAGEQYVIATPCSYVVVSVDADGLPSVHCLPYVNAPVTPTPPPSPVLTGIAQARRELVALADRLDHATRQLEAARRPRGTPAGGNRPTAKPAAPRRRKKRP